MKLGDTIPPFSAITNIGKIENFHEWIGESEILRVIDSMQLSDRMPIATPEGWKNTKEACMVQPTMSMSKAEELFGKVKTVQLPSGRPYLRQVNIVE
ncbi:hypothetical protein NECAME_03162 [Necator americanus]|uniref:Peroxiredoxin C-terminal domain-containing protein n=1 Tax=Necator americanus TaxID=51031 RepID=W2T6I3_NECAM|nr:hypothetical protein NECAME_03162 [Necator americanus]ETN77498.1 hypothetical protein NECAME_03162 [Necator americanus]